jgi:hypothetical protein
MVQKRKRFHYPKRKAFTKKVDLLAWCIDHQKCPLCLEQKLMKVRSLADLRLQSTTVSNGTTPYGYGGRYYFVCQNHLKTRLQNFTIYLK